MQNDPDSLRDFGLSHGSVIKFQNFNDKCVEKTKELADQVIEAESELTEHLTSNNELHFEFEEKLEQLKDLYAQYQAKKAAVSRAAALKVVKENTQALNKESQQLQRQYKKAELNIDDFVTQYRKLRKNYHQSQTAQNYLARAVKS